MAKNLYVGNLPYDTTGEDLVILFRVYGKVVSGQVIIDKFSGRSRGFGFVEMETPEQARAAIEALNNSLYRERDLTVSLARPRDDGGGFGLGSIGGPRPGNSGLPRGFGDRR